MTRDALCTIKDSSGNVLATWPAKVDGVYSCELYWSGPLVSKAEREASESHIIIALIACGTTIALISACAAVLSFLKWKKQA